MFQIVITPAAKKTLKRLSAGAQEELVAIVQRLATDPFVGEKLHGSLAFLYSLHFKTANVQYRVVYSINDDTHLIVIHYVGPRENFYDRVRRLFR